jgi:hypothetical protein
MSAVDVKTEILISATCKKVAEFSSDPDNATAWYVNIKSVEWKTPHPVQPGSLIAFKANFLGKQLSYVYEIAEWIPFEKLVMRTADGPFPMETTYTWETIDENTTRMTLQNKGNPSGFSKLFAPFMSFMMKRANRKDLLRLKQVLEKKNL